MTQCFARARKWLGFSVCMGFLQVAWAGPVNSPGSYPFTDMNNSEDFLLVGDIKGYVRWNGQFSAIPKRLGGAADLYTGGVARRVSAVNAVACSSNQVWLFENSRWHRVEEQRTSGLRCAITRGGLWALADTQQREICLGANICRPLPGSRGAPARLVAMGERFLFLEGRQALIISETGHVSPVDWSDSSLDTLTQLDGSALGIVMADSYGVKWVPFSGSAFEMPQRIPVSPCEDTQMCGVSVADDGSWLVSGYWGTWGGFLGGGWRRVDEVVNFSSSTGGVAVAHSGDQGSFVYAGSDDGDWGRLAALPQTELGWITQPTNRWLIWHRDRDESDKDEGIFSSIRIEANGSHRSLGVSVWSGEIPDEPPTSWVAWEPEVEFASISENFSQLEHGILHDAWWVSAFGRDEAWALAPDTAGVHLGVVDSGVDPSHPWLIEAFARKEGEIPENGVDDDGNGFVDDHWGYDFVEEDGIPQDEFGHGTHVAGLLAARQNGAAYALPRNARLTVVRALDRAGKSNSIDLFRAIAYAVDAGVDVLNCSWGGGRPTQALRDAFTYAYQRGVIVFSSAGNDHLDNDRAVPVPLAFPGVVAVAASDSGGNLARFSNYGKSTVDFTAPGDKIFSLLPGGVWGEKSGTSMASPIAAGLAGWLLGVIGDSSGLEGSSRFDLRNRVLEWMCSTAQPAGSGNSYSRCGQLNAAQATRKALGL